MQATASAQSRSSSVHLYPPKTSVQAASKFILEGCVPHIPEVVLALREELAGPDPSVQRAADLIVRDPAITGDLLKAVNSAAFALSVKVTSVSQAASLMGIQRLTHYVTAVALKRVVEGMDERVHGVWKDIMEETEAMVAIAKRTRSIKAEDAYLFGVMHDIGALIFAAKSGDYISQWVLHSGSEPCLLNDFEHSTMGVDHGALGFIIAAKWKLPEYLALAICHHHAPGHLNAPDPRSSQLVALAKGSYYLIALSRGTHELAEMQTYRDEALSGLDIQEEDWLDLCEKAETGTWD